MQISTCTLRDMRMQARFPTVRMRRMRRTEALRSMVRETTLSPREFVYPLFIREGEGVRQPVGSMPGMFGLSVDEALREVEDTLELDIPAVLLFGIPNSKDERGTGAWINEGIVQRAARELKARFPELVIVTDVCLCEYTSHGHCGILRGATVENDESLEVLSETALSHARAGVDIVAPSNMMDGTVAAIRRGLDEGGYAEVPVMAYAAKYASGFYGPFREAAESTPALGDRRSYQMDPPNRREALREVALDIQEGADIVMVKPALAYLDVIRDVKEMSPVPVAAYSVSGEYAMIKAASQNGWLDERRVVLETLMAIKRAGADLTITYHAKDAARWLRTGTEY